MPFSFSSLPTAKVPFHSPPGSQEEELGESALAAVHRLEDGVAVGDPLREGEDLVGGADLESGGAAIRRVGVEVDRGEVLAVDRAGRVVVLVLHHRQDPAGADLHREGRAADVDVVDRRLWHPLVRGRRRDVLQVAVERRVDLVAAALEVGEPGVLVVAEGGSFWMTRVT